MGVFLFLTGLMSGFGSCAFFASKAYDRGYHDGKQAQEWNC